MENDFRGWDLNLLVLFNVMMRERNVSKAAEALYLGQPAVSNSLAKLRGLLEDDLFVRANGEMVPTTRAEELFKQIQPALTSIHSVIFETEEFNPAKDNRIFNLGMRDWVEAWLMPLLFEKLQELAPGIKIRVHVADETMAKLLIENNEIDLALTNSLEGPRWLEHQSLAKMEYMAIYNEKFLQTNDQLTLAEYVSIPHLTTPTKGDLVGLVDTFLKENGLERRVVYSSTRFNALPLILKNYAGITTVPEPLAKNWQEIYNLKTSRLPFTMDGFELTLSHHAKRIKDPGLIWMKALIENIVLNVTNSRQ
jgi:DNA-binding transcriptional LysR family regulator